MSEGVAHFWEVRDPLRAVVNAQAQSDQRKQGFKVESEFLFIRFEILKPGGGFQRRLSKPGLLLFAPPAPLPASLTKNTHRSGRPENLSLFCGACGKVGANVQ